MGCSSSKVVSTIDHEESSLEPSPNNSDYQHDSTIEKFEKELNNLRKLLNESEDSLNINNQLKNYLE